MKKITYLMLLALVVTAITSAENPVKTKTETTETKEAKKVNKGELAWVTILDFHNGTASKDFDYLAGSISDAIDTSMQKMFEYEKKILQVSPELTKTALSNAAVETFAGFNNLDIVIYGEYGHDPAKNEVIIKTSIYLAYAKKFLKLEEIRNVVDSTIFQATEKTAGLIVDQIKAIALQAKEAQEALDKGKTTILFSSKGNPDTLKIQLDNIKQVLAKKYDGVFLTLDEYLQRSKETKPPEKLQLNKWLQKEGFRPSFEVNEENGQITMKSIVNGEVKGEINYKADAKPEEIEQATNKLAGQLGIPVKSTKTDVKKDEKMTLKTDQLNEQAKKEEVKQQEKQFTWAEAKWGLTIQVGDPRAIGRTNELGYEGQMPEFAFGGYYTFGGLYAGASFFRHKFNLNPEQNYSMTYYDNKIGFSTLMAHVGYRYWFWKNFQITLDLGLGYYFAVSDYSYDTFFAMENRSLDVKNPAFRTQFGFSYLLSRTFSIGVYAAVMHFFDKNSEGKSDNFQIRSLGLAVSYAFR